MRTFAQQPSEKSHAVQHEEHHPNQPPLEQILKTYLTPKSVIQCAKYNELTDKDKEIVDTASQQEYEEQATLFEEKVGLTAARDERSKEAADELLDRTVLLSEVIYFNSPEVESKISLAEHYSSIFGIKDRPDITGGVGNYSQFIQEVMNNGTLREKMTLYYVALAENQTLNKMLLQYKKMLDKEIKTNSQDETYITSLLSLQSFGESITPEKQIKEGYLGNKRKKVYLQRALRWVEMEIALERNAWERTNPLMAKPTPEERIKQKESDQEIAVEIINSITQGVISEDIVPIKKGEIMINEKIGNEIRRQVEEKLRSSIHPEFDTDKITKYKDQSIDNLDTFMTEYRNGMGLVEKLAMEVFTDNFSLYESEVINKAKEKSIDMDNLKNKIKERIVRNAFNAMGKSIFSTGTPSVKKTDKEIKELILASMEDIFSENISGDTSKDTLNKISDDVNKQETDKEEGEQEDNLPQKTASERFNMEFFEPSLFWSKRVVEDSRQGNARILNPASEQTSDATALELEKNPETRLTYRELGSTFYTPEELTILLEKKEFEDREQLRSQMLLEHGNKKLPWKPGMKYWTLDTKSPLKEIGDLLKVKVGAAVSGSTDRVMRGAKYFNFGNTEMEKVLLACLGWMIPAQDHTYYEIMKASEPYLGKLPPHKPFGELVIDINYAEGRGYTRILPLFAFDTKELPDYRLTLEHKDELAEQIFPDYSPQEDKTLRVLSSYEGKIVSVDDEVKYSIRQPQSLSESKKITFEWYWLREGSLEARGNYAASTTEWSNKWGYKGLYKIYCLVLNEENIPMATLRYNQIVYDKTAIRENPEAIGKVTDKSSPTSPEPVRKTEAKITFTSLNGERTEIPVKTSYTEDDSRIECILEIPAIMENELMLCSGSIAKKQQLGNPQGSEVIRLFNQLYRKDKTTEMLQAEALWEAINEWGKTQKYIGTGYINADIYDPDTKVVLKENYFYVDQHLKNIESESKIKIPAFRTQGGDYQSGVKSSVRFVNTRSGEMDISGDAMVWVNFGDKERLIWWLNNRTDRSYSVAFQVSGDFMKLITDNMVPESQSHGIDESGIPNKGKAIISQDKAAHQYAISKPIESKHYANLDELKSAASGMLIKVFQWQTFDIQTQGASMLFPDEGNESRLIVPFNEKLRMAKDLELKIRLLERTNSAAPELPEMRRLQSIKEQEGRKEWEEDYFRNLRKPGQHNLSSSDHRVAGELSDDELFTKRRDILKSAKIINATINRIVGQHLRILKDYDFSQPIDKKNYPLVRDAFAEIKDEVKQQEKTIFTSLEAYPSDFVKDLCTLAANQIIEQILSKNQSFNKLQEPEKSIRKNRFSFSYTINDFGSTSVPIAPTKTTVSSTFGQTATTPPIHQAPLSNTPSTQSFIGGMENAGNTCYIASVMQIIAASTGYSQLFQGVSPNPRIQDIITQGHEIIENINNGKITNVSDIENFRSTLIKYGWIPVADKNQQQDAGDFLRWLLDAVFNTQAGLRFTDQYLNLDKTGGTLSETENIVTTGALQTAHIDIGRSIASLLQAPFQPNIVEDTVTHSRSIIQLPSDLTVQVERYNYNIQQGQYQPSLEIIEINDHIQLTDTAGQVGNYELDSFIIHLGRTHKQGHYITCIKKNTQWYLASDDRITPIDSRQFESYKQQAYICHYRRI